MIKTFVDFIKKQSNEIESQKPENNEVLLSDEYKKCGGKDANVEKLLKSIDYTAYEYELEDIEPIALKDNPNFEKSMALALALQYVKDNDKDYYKKLIILEIGDIDRTEELNDVLDSYEDGEQFK